MAKTLDYRAAAASSDADRTLVDPSPRASAVRPFVSPTLETGATFGVEDARVSLGAAVVPRSVEPRTTVLPRWENGAVRDDSATPRYERVRPLGEGGIGEVALAMDRDIDRAVAIKRLRPEHQGTASLLRFAQEVRTIGRLEHPNIVPVHDVGIDGEGQHFFVMKYVQGETLESVIEKLQAGHSEYLRRFPFEVRSQVFLGILRAVQYAHALGIIHRDIKPANVMVGPYGEVMVMDWGLAKQIRGVDALSVPPSAGAPGVAPGKGDGEGAVSEHSSSYQTQNGAVMGTPAYMSPEQARGEIGQLDERSDVYSLAVLFHEFVTLRHYLHDKTTLEEVLASVASAADHEKSIAGWIADAVATGAPMEILHFVRRGMAGDAAQRYADAGEMAQALEDMLAGRVKIQCHISMTKRVAHAAMHWIDRHPLSATVALLAVVLSVVASAAGLVRALLGALHVLG